MAAVVELAGKAAEVAGRAAAFTDNQRASRWSLAPFGFEDWPAAQRLWAACYPGTPASFWDQALQRLRSVPCTDAHAPLGVFLMNADGPQGLALLLSSQRPAPAVFQSGLHAGEKITGPGDELVHRNKPSAMHGVRHVNGSSWAILPATRGRALWMARQAFADPHTVYSALTPIPTVGKLLQLVDFHAVTHQHILAATPRLALAAARSRRGRRSPVLSGRQALHALRDHPLASALQDHVRLGCEVLALHQAESAVPAARAAPDESSAQWVPLVLRRYKRLGRVPAAELIYAPSQQQVADHADVLGAALLKRGYLLLGFDAHEDLHPDFGCTRLFQRRYGRGQTVQRGIDYLYSELVYLHR